MDGIIDAILEIRRQRRLTRALGQIECGAKRHGERCPWCKAVV